MENDWLRHEVSPFIVPKSLSFFYRNVSRSFYIFSPVLKNPLEWLYDVGKAYSSKNIIATDSPASAARFDLIFVAHYDSKSQVLPIAVRAVCYWVAGAGLIGLTLLTIIQIPLQGRLPSPLIWSIGGCVCFCLLLLQFNFTQNRSPGAI